MKRIQEIRKLFLSRKNVTNVELCEHFGVSIETIRRDLNILEEEGFIRKVYGGACLVENSQTPIPIDEWSVRMEKLPIAKHSMALEVARLIPDGSTIFLDSGTTIYFVANCLKEKRDLTIFTNSIRIIETLSQNKTFQIYMIGGIIQPDVLASTGVFANEFLGNFFHLDYAVLSCDGLIPDKGTTEHSIELSIIKKNVISKSGKIVIVADHSKIGITASSLCCHIGNIDTAIVDADTTDDHIATMVSHGVEVIRAS